MGFRRAKRRAEFNFSTKQKTLIFQNKKMPKKLLEQIELFSFAGVVSECTQFDNIEEKSFTESTIIETLF